MSIATPEERTATENTPSAVKVPKVFYGWWIVLAGALSSGLTGTVGSGLSTLFVPLRNEFGWSRTALNLAYSLTRFESGLLGPPEGMLVDKFGPRLIMYFGMIMTFLGLLALTQVNSLTAFYLVFVLFLAIGTSLASAVPIFTAVNYWFIRKRGRALGMAMSGSLMTLFTLPLVALAINSFGWRWTAAILAFVLITLGLPLASVMRQRPEKYGLLPDGDTQVDKPTAAGKTGQRKKAVEEVNFTPWEALKSPSFWFLSLAHTIGLGTLTTVMSNQALHLTNQGLSLAQASLVMGLTTAPQAFARVGLGFLGDFIPKRYIIAFCFLLISLGLVLNANVHSFWGAIPYILVFGIGDGGRGTLIVALRGDYFGRESFATIQGIQGAIKTVGLAGFPLMTAYIADRTGSYASAFYILAGLNLFALLFLLLSRKPKPPARLASATPSTASNLRPS